ncbi:hypothetical protein NDU88_005957 [Pleurodeles waltl]|uniref:Uncharacterized protein n=1 Tax=Pleurodeles waltl TaxID=8319 RepID=A0AAV7NS15_PLEWA|nr:hypothetical protein NDU88_005957 [Pleurodeles waltl]
MPGAGLSERAGTRLGVGPRASAEDGVTVTGGACGPSVPILAGKEKQQERGPGCREPCCGADPACGTDTHFEHRHTPAERAGPREGRPEGGKYRTLGRARSDRGATCWMVVPVVAYCVNGALAPELGTSMVGPEPQSMKDRPAASGETGIPGRLRLGHANRGTEYRRTADGPGVRHSDAAPP